MNACSERLSAPPVAPCSAVAGHLAEALLVAAIALLPRLAWLDADAHIDELYHLLAAEGWLRSGELQIGSGLYERAWLFTLLIGGFLGAVGDTLQVARLPAVLAGTGLVVAVFLWVRAEGGRLAAWLAALLMALSPLAVELSQMARFYTLHALAFWLAAILVYTAARPGLDARARLGFGVAAFLPMSLALHLQMLTAVGLLGLALWLSLQALPPALLWLRSGPWHRLLMPVALALLALLVLALAVQSGLAARTFEQFRWAPLWAQEFRNRPHFYHLRLAGQYPVLWPLAGFLALSALAWRPRPAGFCAVLFGTAFALGSLAGMKDDRYLFYALPFLFGLFALGLAGLYTRLRLIAIDTAEQSRARVAPWLPAWPVRTGLVAAALLFMLSAGSAPAMLAFDLARGVQPHGPGRITADWWRAAPALAAHRDRADVVLVSDELAALAALGRADILISGTRRSELQDAITGRDPRTGVRVIDDVAAVQSLLRCAPHGLIVLSTRDLAFGWSIPEPVRQAIENGAERLPLGSAPELAAFVWQHDAGTDQACGLALAATGLPAR